MGSIAHSSMVKFLKDGKIVVCLQGRYAGKKAAILKTNDEGNKDRPYGHCVVAGVAKAPLPITKAMCKTTAKMKKLVQRRSHVKTFIKIVNFSHVMPTRYTVESGMTKALKGFLTADTFTDPAAKKKFLKSARATFEAKYKENVNDKSSGNNRWLFEKLRF